VIVLIVVAGLFFLIPTAIGTRLWLACAMLVTTFVVMTPVTPLSEEGVLDFVGPILLFALLGTATLALGARWVLELVLSFSTSEYADHRDEWSFDYVLACIAGFCTGLGMPLALAVMTRGASGGLALHLVVAGAAALLIILAWRTLSGLVRPFTVTLLAVFTFRIISGALMWPDMIDRAALDRSAGAPFCLRSAEGPVTVAEKMLLTMPASAGAWPGLVLTVMTPRGPEHARWSLRGKRFVTLSLRDFGPCP
jgi:hypothetical protein